MEQLTKPTLEKAEELLSRAHKELYKPAEDVVPYSVCTNAYYAIVNYLKSYLIDHQVTFEESLNVPDLLAICRAIDGKFNDLQLAPLYYPLQTKDVWMSLETVNSFMAMAENTRKIVCEK